MDTAFLTFLLTFNSQSADKFTYCRFSHLSDYEVVRDSFHLILLIFYNTTEKSSREEINPDLSLVEYQQTQCHKTNVKKWSIDFLLAFVKCLCQSIFLIQKRLELNKLKHMFLLKCYADHFN